MSDKKVAVIGAGLSGLSAAIALQDAGCEVEVFESSDRVGGRVATDIIDGYRLDRGFQLINSRYPELIRLGVIQELDFVTASRSIDISLGTKTVSLGDPRLHPFSALSSETGSIFTKISFLKYLTTKAETGLSVEDELKEYGALYQRVLKPFFFGEKRRQLRAFDVAARHAHHIFQRRIGKQDMTIGANHRNQGGQQIKGMKALAWRGHRVFGLHGFTSLGWHSNEPALAASQPYRLRCVGSRL